MGFLVQAHSRPLGNNILNIGYTWALSYKDVEDVHLTLITFQSSPMVIAVPQHNHQGPVILNQHWL